MRRGVQVLSVLFFWLVLVGAASAEKRVALVIGNAGYESVPRLTNPTNDAAAIAEAFTRLGFTVNRQADLGFDAMRRALKDFAGTAAGADLAVIYYAGHGMEIGGDNYLVPIDAKLATDVDVPYEAISVNLALGALDGARGTRLLILDACRNNPFLAKIHVGARSRSIGRGLARVEPGVGTIVAYAAKEGTTAEDGDADHSPFTKALLKHIEEPGIDVQFLFREVRDTVLEDTNGNQEPFTYGSLPGRAVLLSPAKEPLPPPPSAASDAGNEIAAEVAFWNTVEKSGDRKLLESYLTQYPNGRFASLARIFIARIDSEAAPPPKAAAETPAVVAAAPIAPTRVEPSPAEAAGKDAAAEPAKPPTKVAEAGTGNDAADRTVDAKAIPTEAATAGKTDTGSDVPAGGDAPGSGDAGAVPSVGPVAALPPASEPVETAKPDRELVRDIQKELARVGCSAGSADGAWGKKARNAVDAFVRYSKVSLASLDPSPDLLSTLKSYGGRACPLVCTARYEPQGDSCVLKTCPSGQTLTNGGDCYAPAPKQKQAVLPAAPSVSKKKSAPASASSGGCVRETAQQCIGRLSANHGGASLFGKGGSSDFEIEARCSAPANRACR
jgi:hypothetical protein